MTVAGRVWPAGQAAFMPWGAAITATYLRRPNRFTVVAELGGEVTPCHLPSTGRLGELLVPGARLLVRPAGAPSRKTAYDVLAVWFQGAYTAVDTRLAGALVKRQLELCPPPWLPSGRWRPEVAYRKGRLDFGLEGRVKALMEVKTATLVAGDVARFPDAPTARGTRHLHLLLEARGEGFWAGIWFLVMREGARCLRPNEANDPAFAAALRAAVAGGVEVRASTVAVRPEGLTLSGEIPVLLS